MARNDIHFDRPLGGAVSERIVQGIGERIRAGKTRWRRVGDKSTGLDDGSAGGNSVDLVNAQRVSKRTCILQQFRHRHCDGVVLLGYPHFRRYFIGIRRRQRSLPRYLNALELSAINATSRRSSAYSRNANV